MKQHTEEGDSMTTTAHLPAFPAQVGNELYYGLTKREFMATILAKDVVWYNERDPKNLESAKQTAEHAVILAEALILALNQRGE